MTASLSITPLPHGMAHVDGQANGVTVSWVGLLPKARRLIATPRSEVDRAGVTLTDDSGGLVAAAWRMR